MQSLSCFFFSFILLLNNTSHAQPEDYPSNLDSGVAALQPQDETNLQNLFVNDSAGLVIPGADLFTTGNFDDPLFSTSPISDIPVSGDGPNLDLFASTVDSCSFDSNPKVKRGQSCRSDTDGSKSSAGNPRARPGVLTPEIIDYMIRTTPYGLELTTESDHVWCDPMKQRKYTVCDSGFSYDRIPIMTPFFSDSFDLYDCSPCAFFFLLLSPLFPPSSFFRLFTIQRV